MGPYALPWGREVSPEVTFVDDVAEPAEGWGMDDAVELSDFIAALRRELILAMRSGEGEELRFEAGPVELELELAVEKVVGPEATIRFWVFDIAASAKRTRSVTQRMKLTLEPRRSDAPLARPLITGESLPGER
jgi:hypothetical protein